MRASTRPPSTFARKTLHVTSARALRLATAFKHAKLKPGAKLTVSVTKPGLIGTFVELSIRAGRSPKKTTLCLEPGAAKPQKACS